MKQLPPADKSKASLPAVRKPGVPRTTHSWVLVPTNKSLCCSAERKRLCASVAASWESRTAVGGDVRFGTLNKIGYWANCPMKKSHRDFNARSNRFNFAAAAWAFRSLRPGPAAMPGTTLPRGLEIAPSTWLRFEQKQTKGTKLSHRSGRRERRAEKGRTPEICHKRAQSPQGEEEASEGTLICA